MNHVERRNEKLVCILLLVPGQVFGIAPNKQQETIGGDGIVTGWIVEELENVLQFAHDALFCFKRRVTGFMLLEQEIIA